MKKGTITSISGPVVHAEIDGSINDICTVGKQELLAEIIEIQDDKKILQVYEDTTGLSPGQPVQNTEKPLSVELGPGLLGTVYDGTQRPLLRIKEEHGNFIARGLKPNALRRDTKWEFTAAMESGDNVEPGDILGYVEENPTITHKVLAPTNVSGTIERMESGDYAVDDVIATINGEDITLMQSWPVRKPRPVAETKKPLEPLITGQRVLDFLFPIPKGGVAAIPGPFGAGKTVTQQQLAKWCDADIIVYIGCGERGNEMTEVLEEFPELEDPNTGRPLMERTVLIANTSNMPVAAREASVYTGITIAEYYRDQGYDVALMADSTSRWAEAMREISGRLEEMPGEEGYPAYLSKRLASFYERAGINTALSGETGSISVVGAVSPPGGDFSEPVTQNTLRLVKAFLALDSSLANKRHFPSINWLQSYSLYKEDIAEGFAEHTSEDWAQRRRETEELLQKEKELQEIVQLVGKDSLPKSDQLTLLITRLIREDFLQQNAFHPDDTYCALKKQYGMINAILTLRSEAHKSLESLNIEALETSEVTEKIAQLKYRAQSDFENIDDFAASMKKTITASIKKATQ